MKNQTKEFGKFLLDDKKLKRYMSPLSFSKYKKAKTNYQQLDAKTAKEVANAAKKWAISLKVSDFSHWFVPLSGGPAEKRISILNRLKNKTIATLSFSDVACGEADASSFDCGNSRTTSSARGYAIWDYSSPMFITQDSTGNRTLNIPSMFFSHGGEALDQRTPLLRATSALSREATRILSILGCKCSKVELVSGIEQEYFLLKTDEDSLSRHYYCKVSDKVSDYMASLARKLSHLGIIAKQQHGEVSPGQFEIVTLHDCAVAAADQNLLVMQTAKIVAKEHGMTAIFHEKPFANFSGSGKHQNWSLQTDTGLNLFDVNMTNKSIFYVFMCATIAATDNFGNLLTLSAKSKTNDLRLGASEAPPNQFSVFLGDTLFDELCSFKFNSKQNFLKTNVWSAPKIKKQNCDRNRTSPFAFTGNKFEFRMLGSNGSVYFSSTCFALALAKTFKEFADAAEKSQEKRKKLLNIAKNSFKTHKKVVFNGNCYNLPKPKNQPLPTETFSQLLAPEIIKTFSSLKILSKNELKIWHQVLCKQY